jgi:hypothetical protein
MVIAVEEGCIVLVSRVFLAWNNQLEHILRGFFLRKRKHVSNSSKYLVR